MVILDNIIFELQSAGGISAYWSEIVRRSFDYDTVYFGRKNSNIFAESLSIVLRDECYPSYIPRRYLPFSTKKSFENNEKHIFHSSYFRYSNNPAAINVTTVHDFTYEYFVAGLRQWVHSRQKMQAVKKSKGIICVSENTKADLLRFYPWVDPDSVRVIYNGVSIEFRPIESARDLLAEKLGFYADKPYFLFVGDRSPYKNFNSCIGLAAEFPEMDLVVVGGAPFSEKELNHLEGIKERVHHFRGISSEVLNLLYNSAFCFVYPSSYEGFGIPVLEAMGAGCPVVSTNLSSIPEVAGDAAILVDELTVESFASALYSLKNPVRRSELIKKGFEQAARFSWDKCFEETQSFYNDLLNNIYHKY